jgi:hypothetical protein
VNRLSRGRLATLTGAAIGLIGALSLAAGVAGATAIGAGIPTRAPAIAPTGLTVGSYKVFVNGAGDGTISFASNYTYSSGISGDDAGSWIEAGKTIIFDVTSGTDTGSGCVFVGNLTSKTTINSAASPGKYSCPGHPANGTWYVKGAGAAAAQAPSGDSVDSAHAAATSGFATGKYTMWAVVEGATINFGKVTYANGHTFSGTTDDDSGSWAASGTAFGMLITSGNSDDVGCLFVGTLTSTGINSSAAPAPYTGCNGDDTVDGTWWAKEKK